MMVPAAAERSAAAPASARAARAQQVRAAKGKAQATVVAVEVGTERRHNRMLRRGRAGEDNRAYLRDRDRAEVRRGVRDVMRRADMRRPRGDSLESLDRSLDRVLRGLDAPAR